jgi:integrase
MEDVSRFCEKWPIGTKPRLALELLLHSGIRRSDVCRAGRQHLNGNVFSMRTAKTGAVVTLEFSNHLVDVIGKTPTGDLHFTTNAFGRPFTKESFGNWFGERCRESGVFKSAHGLRKLSATIAANAGATAHELMALYGWATTQQAEIYTKGADRARLGVKSSRLVAEQIEAAKTPHLIPGAGRKPKSKAKSKAI